VNQEDSEQNEVDGMKKEADSTGKGDAYVKERLVICNEEDTDGPHGQTTALLCRMVL